MAKIYQEQINIILSKLVKDDHPEQAHLINDEIINALEQVVQELVGDKIIVEIGQ